MTSATATPGKANAGDAAIGEPISRWIALDSADTDAASDLSDAQRQVLSLVVAQVPPTAVRNMTFRAVPNSDPVNALDSILQIAVQPSPTNAFKIVCNVSSDISHIVTILSLSVPGRQYEAVLFDEWPENDISSLHWITSLAKAWGNGDFGLVETRRSGNALKWTVCYKERVVAEVIRTLHVPRKTDEEKWLCGSPRFVSRGNKR